MIYYLFFNLVLIISVPFSKCNLIQGKNETCAIPPIPIGASFKLEHVPLTISYSCDKSRQLKLIGSRVRKCRKDKGWTGVSPICVQDVSPGKKIWQCVINKPVSLYPTSEIHPIANKNPSFSCSYPQLTNSDSVNQTTLNETEIVDTSKTDVQNPWYLMDLKLSYEVFGVELKPLTHGGGDIKRENKSLTNKVGPKMKKFTIIPVWNNLEIRVGDNPVFRNNSLCQVIRETISVMESINIYCVALNKGRFMSIQMINTNRHGDESVIKMDGIVKQSISTSENNKKSLKKRIIFAKSYSLGFKKVSVWVKNIDNNSMFTENDKSDDFSILTTIPPPDFNWNGKDLKIKNNKVGDEVINLKSKYFNMADIATFVTRKEETRDILTTNTKVISTTSKDIYLGDRKKIHSGSHGQDKNKFIKNLIPSPEYRLFIIESAKRYGIPIVICLVLVIMLSMGIKCVSRKKKESKDKLKRSKKGCDKSKKKTARKKRRSKDSSSIISKLRNYKWRMSRKRKAKNDNRHLKMGSRKKRQPSRSHERKSRDKENVRRFDETAIRHGGSSRRNTVSSGVSSGNTLYDQIDDSPNFYGKRGRRLVGYSSEVDDSPTQSSAQVSPLPQRSGDNRKFVIYDKGLYRGGGDDNDGVTQRSGEGKYFGSSSVRESPSIGHSDIRKTVGGSSKLYYSDQYGTTKRREMKERRRSRNRNGEPVPANKYRTLALGTKPKEPTSPRYQNNVDVRKKDKRRIVVVDAREDTNQAGYSNSNRKRNKSYQEGL